MNTRKNSLRIFLIIAALLLFTGAASFVTVRTIITTPPAELTEQAQPTPTPTLPTTTTASQTLVYGRWLEGSSQIRAVNTDATFDSLIARLPLTIKDVNIISSTYLLYIADTNNADHGKRIILYNINTEQEQTLATAQSGWGIDDVIVSPDKTWIAWWEVKLSPNGKLLGGRSRVISAQLSLRNTSLQTSNIIFDEAATSSTPLHYPLFFDHANNLYTDGFIPNGGGWNRGLTRSSPTGQDPTTALADGTYNSDPLLNPAQNTVAYTGTRLTTTALFSAGRIQNLFGLAEEATPPGIMRTTALTANELLLLNLQTNQQTSLLAGPGREYFDAVWDSNGQYLYVKSFTRQDGKLIDGEFLKINITTLEVEELPGEAQPPGLLLVHSPDGFISGIPATTEVPANLGQNYTSQLLSISTGTAANPRTLVSDTAQFIGLINRPSAQQLAFATTLLEQTAESLKLATFNPKPPLAQRPAQQNDGRVRCRDLVQKLIEQGELPTGTTRREGFRYIRANGYKCYDSPLYLYPHEPTEVTIKVTNATILSANPEYDPDKGWQVIAYPDGSIEVPEKNVHPNFPLVSNSTDSQSRTKSLANVLEKGHRVVLSKIDYSYLSYSSSFTPPTTGFIFSRADLPKKLYWYAQQLGLTDREISDFTRFWLQELPDAPFYLVSHFKNPSAIMDFDIDPQPSTFIQAIMYFKSLGNSELKTSGVSDVHRTLPDVKQNRPTLDPPSFPSIPPRFGFTAVDWSGIIDP